MNTCCVKEKKTFNDIKDEYLDKDKMVDCQYKKFLVIVG